MSATKILVVDDESVVHKLIERYLQEEGLKIIKAYDGEEALRLFRLQRPGLVLLDVLMPGLDGISVCQEIRRHSDVPILFITAKDGCSDLAQGFGAGADDYIKKPFDPVELVIRLRAHLRRYRQLKHVRPENHNAKSPVLAFNGLKIDKLNRIVKKEGLEVILTPKEFDLLLLLAENANRYFSTNRLIEIIWDHPKSIDQRSLMVHISNLRKKIEADPANPKYIISTRGYGYKFDDRRSHKI